MITINLMPHLSSVQRQQRASVRRQVVMGITVVLLSVTACWVWGMSLSQEQDRIRQDKRLLEDQLALIMAKHKENEQRESAQDRIVAQVRFLSNHGEHKYVPVFALDEISQSLESLGVWLTGVSIDHENMVIEGHALTRQDVRRLIGNLEDSSTFQGLVKMETQPYRSGSEDYQRFTLQFSTKS